MLDLLSHVCHIVCVDEVSAAGPLSSVPGWAYARVVRIKKRWAMSVVINSNKSLASARLSAAELETLRAVNAKIALARTDPAKVADDAWLCICTVH